MMRSGVERWRTKELEPSGWERTKEKTESLRRDWDWAGVWMDGGWEGRGRVGMWQPIPDPRPTFKPS